MPELRGRNGVQVYREMSENDETVGAIFVEPCMNDMQETWTDTLSEILSFLTYGWSYHEIVYKYRRVQKSSGKQPL